MLNTSDGRDGCRSQRVMRYHLSIVTTVCSLVKGLYFFAVLSRLHNMTCSFTNSRARLKIVPPSMNQCNFGGCFSSQQEWNVMLCYVVLCCVRLGWVRLCLVRLGRYGRVPVCMYPCLHVCMSHVGCLSIVCQSVGLSFCMHVCMLDML